MIDRLAELKKGGISPDDIAIDVGGSSSGSNFMPEFFNDVEVVKKTILVVRNSTTRISEINQQVILATTNQSENEESQELEMIINDTNKKAKITQNFLKKIKQSTDDMKASPTSKQSEVRIRENLTNTLARKFIDVMKEYQNAQTKYKTDIKKKVKRQIQIVKPDVTAEEIDTLMRSGDGSGAIMKEAI